MLFSNEFHSFALFFAFVRIYSGKFSKFFLISVSPPCFFHFLSLYQKSLLCPSFSRWGNVASGMEAGAGQKIQICWDKFWRRWRGLRTCSGIVELSWCCFLSKLFCFWNFLSCPMFSSTGYFLEACLIVLFCIFNLIAHLNAIIFSFIIMLRH